MRLLFLDGTGPDLSQARWLDEQLAVPGPTFSVVVFHPPVYSCGLHGPTPPDHLVLTALGADDAVPDRVEIPTSTPVPVPVD